MPFNREEWLQKVVQEYRKDFRKLGVTLPVVHISVGQTGLGRTIGVTYERKYSEDNHNHIFISPTISDTEYVVAIVAHELVHVALDCEHGHQKPFQLLARQIGLTKPYTQSIPTQKMEDRITEIVKVVGKYKHKPLRDPGEPVKCKMR